jgi:hypothetical protein
MKKILIILVLMALAFNAKTQDIYSVGYYDVPNGTNAALYKNSERLYIVHKPNQTAQARHVACDSEGNVYWWVNLYSFPDNTLHHVEIWKNKQLYASTENHSDIKLNDMYCLDDTLYYVGYQRNDTTVAVATVWKGPDFTPHYILGDGIHASVIYDADVDKSTNIPYYCGYIKDSLQKASVWKASELLFKQEPWGSQRGSYAYEISIDNGSVYTNGYLGYYTGYETVSLCTIWKDNERVYYGSDDDFFDCLYAYQGDFYFTYSYPHGFVYDVCKNTAYNKIMHIPGSIYRICGETDDIYMVGKSNGQGCIWKNFEVLLQPDNSTVLYDMAVSYVNEEEPIIYTDFEPDLSKYITWLGNSSGRMDSLDVDINQDGQIDLWFSGYVQHGTLLPTTHVSQGWEYCYPYPKGNTLLNADTLQWNQATDDWLGTGAFMGRIGLRRTIGDQHYYGWMQVYCDTVPTQPYPGAIGRNIYIDRMAYCTLPDYPLRWGQTSMESIAWEGSEWYYEIQNDDGSITYQHLECVGDTLIDRAGKRPKIIVRSNTHYDRDTVTEMTHEYIYEENGVVYWWNKDLEEFTTLYNLTANVGDEWEIKVGTEGLTMHVEAVENLEYEGRTYRMIKVSDPEQLFSGDIVCGIGHLTSFFPEKLMNRGKSYRVEGMRCYWVEGDLVFKYGDRDCYEVYQELHYGLDETNDNGFTVYPNPANNILFVRPSQFDSPTTGQTEYHITNLMGQTLLQGSINTENQQIDISTLPAGMYFINVGEQTTKFVVK